MELYSNKRFSLFEFNDLKTKDENKYELIDGIVLMSPRPNYKHQEIMSRLNLEIGTYLRGKNCMVFTEAELEFNNDVLIPDLSVICGLDNSDFQRYKKAPEIVIEIISPSSKYTDTFTKLYKYELFGVKEYWIANPKTETLTIYNFENKTNNDYCKHENLISSVFNDLIINLSNIFL
ncbi:MAG: Uma2 family endonuclease [Sedimentibacter sp.]|uniref:Uma2 family endonuclease n=1 Tax=Sedimentibacter sp. TaxID=1960295 RepID=UPI0029828774|nr:Uma2 family endonuclease [Sedimentibacter sp.]MDW5299888.1 Uma2 family endonuclease [Sedimentibacter sp.]